MSAAPDLVLCSKSPWEPAVRREHAWAKVAAGHGHRVRFVARPDDVRALRAGVGAVGPYVRGLVPGRGTSRPAPGIVVERRSTLAPGHRHPGAAKLDGLLLGATLRAASTPASSVVCCVPWDWPAVARAPARRRVFDLADDWSELMPGREELFRALYRRIAAEADAVVVVNPAMRRHFPDRDVAVIRNGLTEEMLVPATTAAVPRTMIYVGTFTPRFDAPLAAEVLRRLPDWRLELVGPCLYPGRGDAPGDELLALLEAHPGRAAWHGAQPREDVVRWLDAAAVAVLPNRPAHSVGQDSMKLYDYAARGRPIVTTPWDPDLERTGPPHLAIAADAEAFATAVRRAAEEPEERAAERVTWARGQTFAARWGAWSRAVFG